MGDLEAFVANAGVIAGGLPAWELPAEQQRALLEVNLESVILAGRLVAPSLLGRPRPRSGRFVAVTSSGATRGMSGPRRLQRREGRGGGLRPRPRRRPPRQRRHRQRRRPRLDRHPAPRRVRPPLRSPLAPRLRPPPTPGAPPRPRRGRRHDRLPPRPRRQRASPAPPSPSTAASPSDPPCLRSHFPAHTAGFCELTPRPLDTFRCHGTKRVQPCPSLNAFGSPRTKSVQPCVAEGFWPYDNQNPSVIAATLTSPGPNRTAATARTSGSGRRAGRGGRFGRRLAGGAQGGGADAAAVVALFRLLAFLFEDVGGDRGPGDDGAERRRGSRRRSCRRGSRAVMCDGS